MKKIFIALIILLSAKVAAIAQVTIQPGLPAVGLIQKNQLWNVLIVNGSTTAYKCILSISLKDRSTGIDVLTATSGQFDVNAGAKQLNVNLLNPIQYNYVTGGADNRMQGLLPVGTYMACYQLVTTATGKTETLAEECVQFDAEPLSPPMLIYPADSALLENLPNQFSWIPPTPEGMFDKLRYELLITEVKEGQRAEEALQDNIPFYNDGALFSNKMNYPASAAAFEKDKWYAWQVTVRDDKAYAGKSEVWVFKILNESVKKIIEMAPYIKLSTKPEGVTTVHQGFLKMEYYNFLSDSVVDIIIKNENAKQNQFFFKLKINPGQNYLQYEIGKRLKLEENSIYEAILINSGGEQFVMKFEPKNY
jgi:hypothetical protein